jgi:hypothetical protein
MKTKIVLQSVFVCLLISLINIVLADQKALPPKYDETELKKQYDAFLLNLDYVKIANDYPKTIKDLLSDVPDRQAKALRELSETSEPSVIPWILPFLDSEDGLLKISAGSSIEKVVSNCALRRRDRTHSDRVVLRPLAVGDLDLRPLGWVALKMFRKPDDGNTHAYAASVTRYLEIREFEDELRNCLKSKHPAVSEKAKWSLESLGFAVKDSGQ